MMMVWYSSIALSVAVIGALAWHDGPLFQDGRYFFTFFTSCAMFGLMWPLWLGLIVIWDLGKRVSRGYYAIRRY